MMLLDVVTCARPVLFANDNPEFPFSVGGTAFIAKFQRRSFVITAKHVLNLCNFAAGQFSIQYRPDGRDFLPLGALHLARGANEEDTDQYDIAVREINDAGVREELYGPYLPYSLLQMDRLTLFSERGAYIYRGYPIAMREVDFENHHVEQCAVTTRAEYVGRTRYEALHELRLLGLGPLASIDGLSGSPVFQVHNEEGTKYSREAFAGMLLRGSIESGRVFLIEHRRIIEVLTQVIQGASP